MGATSVGEIGLDLVVNHNSFEKQMTGVERMARRAGAALAGAFATKKLVDFGKKCLDLGSDLSEVQNVVDVTFSAMTARVDEFAKSALNSFGLSETMAKRYTGTFGAMAKAFGFAEKDAFEMSSTLTGLAGDVASFYNISQNEAYTKLKSVFTGETESLKDLGVVMTQAALDQYALANGFGKTTSAMSEAEKVALRYQFVQEKLSAAQGDFARTSGSWANQCRILSLQVESVMATVGQGLINLFTPIIKTANVVIGKIATLANAFKAFTELITGNQGSGSSQVANPVSEVGELANSAADGLAGASSAADGLANSTKGAGAAAEKAAKQMRTLMGFDKINKVSSPADSGSGSGGSAGGVGSAGGLGAAVNFGSLAQGETVVDQIDGRMQRLINRCEVLSSLFRKGFQIGFGDSEKKIVSITKSVQSIGKSLKSIFTDAGVVSAANRLTDQVALSFGKMAGSAARIGLTIPGNLLGGLDRYLQGNGEFLKKNIVSIFDVSAEIAALSGRFYVALADIFDVFSSPTAKQCTADLIGIFSDGFFGVTALGANFVRDIAAIVVTPVTENVGKIRLAFEGILAPIGLVLSVLHMSVQLAFERIGKMYEEHIKPLVDSLVAGITSLVSIFLDAWNTHISPVLDQVAQKFETVWNDSIQPLINTAIGLIGQISDLLKTLWEQIIYPIIEEFINTSAPVLGQALSNIGNWVLDLFGTVGEAADGILTALSGVIEFFTGVFSQDWEKTTHGISQISEGLQKSVSSVFGFIRDKVMQPFDNFLTGIFERDWSESFGTFGEVLNTFFDGAEKVWNGVKEKLSEIITYIRDIFTGDWETTWQNCVDAFSTVFGGLVDILKTPVNGVIALLNGLIRSVNSLLATIESHLRFDFTIPNPFGGTIVDYHWQATLPRIKYRIPALADGGYVKKNTPRLALIGDNRHYGEIVAPENKMQAIVDEAVRRASGGGGITKEELETLINRAVMRIISALASVGFNLDGEQVALLQRMAQTSIDRRFNTVEIT